MTQSILDQNAGPNIGDLSHFRTNDLFSELLKRANAALSRRENEEAERLLSAAHAYAPTDGWVLQVLAEIALSRRDWNAATERAAKSLALKLPPEVFVRAAAIYCSARWMDGGEDAVRPLFEQIRAKLESLCDRVKMPEGMEILNLGTAVAMLAGDHPLARKLFHKRYAEFLFGEVETTISNEIDIRSWCERNHAPFEVLEPPRHVTSNGLPNADGTWSYMTDGVNVATIPGGEMLSGLDFAMTPTGEFLRDSRYISPGTGTGWFPRVCATPTRRVMHLWPKKAISLDIDVLFLSCTQGFHVGHWIVDFLPRLRAITKSRPLKVAVPTELPGKHRDLLALFGIGPDQIVNCDLGLRYKFRNLIVTQTGNPCRPEINNVCFVTEGLRTNPPPAVRRRRIFLERDVKSRAIANQAELNAELDRWNFDRLSLAAMSIAEQRAALSAAEVVITTYGSDLLAHYMMTEGAHFIELNWDPVKLNAASAPMCSMVGIRYQLVRCEAAVNSEHQFLKKDHDFVVDIDALRRALAGIFANNHAAA